MNNIRKLIRKILLVLFEVICICYILLLKFVKKKQKQKGLLTMNTDIRKSMTLIIMY